MTDKFFVDDTMQSDEPIEDGAETMEAARVSGHDSFESFAETLPETAEELGAPRIAEVTPGNAGITAAASEGERRTKRLQMTKRMRKTMDKFKERICSFPVMFFDAAAKDNPEWALSRDEKDILTDSLETVFEVLDVDFAIDPIAVTLQSIWWVLAYPILVFGFIFLSKKQAVAEKNKSNAK